MIDQVFGQATVGWIAVILVTAILARTVSYWRRVGMEHDARLTEAGYRKGSYGGWEKK